MSKPQTFVVSIPNPFVKQSPWTKETYRLIGDFKVDFERQQGPGASRSLSEGYLLMASDYLEERFGSDAHWDRLDMAQLFERFEAFAVHPTFVLGMISVLGAFYCYLGNIGRVRPQMHARMRQLCLDALVIGPEAALEFLREESAARRDVGGYGSSRPLH